MVAMSQRQSLRGEVPLALALVTSDDLIAIEEIRQLKSRYFRLMDQKRWDEWVDIFTDDVTIDTSDEGIAEIIRGNKAFVEFLVPLLDGVITVHHGHMPEITITGSDSASGVWSMEDHLVWPPDKGGNIMWGTGWYEETYRRGGDGKWRIATLKLRRIRVELNGERVFPRPA